MPRRSRRPERRRHGKYEQVAPIAYDPPIPTPQPPRVIRLPPELPEKIDFRLRRQQTFSETAAANYKATQDSFLAIGARHGLLPRAISFNALHLAMLGSKQHIEAIRHHGNRRTVDTQEFHRELFITVSERLGDLATAPLIAPVESITFSQTPARQTVFNAVLGGAARDEIRIVHTAVNDVCGKKLFHPDVRPRIPIAVIESQLTKEDCEAFDEIIQETTLGRLRFGPLQLPDTYPSF